MNRNYKSGARKRKLADEKKLKEKEALLNVPKIDTWFGAPAGPSTSHSDLTLNDIVIDEEPASDSEVLEVELVASLTDSQTETEGCGDCDANIENVVESAATSTFEEGSESNPLEQFPTDAALWSIETDIISLQKYWLQKGR